MTPHSTGDVHDAVWDRAYRIQRLSVQLACAAAVALATAVIIDWGRGNSVTDSTPVAYIGVSSAIALMGAAVATMIYSRIRFRQVEAHDRRDHPA